MFGKAIPQWAFNVAFGAITLLAVLAVAAALLAGQYVCHQYIAPVFTGGDPVASALFCRPTR